MLFRLALSILIVIAIGLIGWRWSGSVGVPTHTDNTPTAPAGSDYYMRNATIYQMNKKGELTYRIQLGKTLHYPNKSARLQNIRVHYEGENTKTPWVLEAARGRIPPGSHDLHLTGGVTLHTPESASRQVSVHTSNAWVRIQRDVVESHAHVTARSPDRTVEADGLHIDLDKHQLKLRNNVQVHYTP